MIFWATMPYLYNDSRPNNKLEPLVRRYARLPLYCRSDNIILKSHNQYARRITMNKKLFSVGVASIAALGLSLAAAAPAFAHPVNSNQTSGSNGGQSGNNNGGQPGGDNGGQPGNNNGGQPGNNLPGPNGDYFLLTHFSAKPVAGKSDTYTLTVTVEQYQSDSDDYTSKSPTSEIHKFPTSVPVKWNNGTVNASLQPGAGTLTYQKNGSGTISATAQYTVTFPRALRSTTNLSIGPFYMVGPVQPNSPDDIVYDSPITIPYGQLPEVPWAAGLPLIAGAAGVVMVLRHRARA